MLRTVVVLKWVACWCLLSLLVAAAGVHRSLLDKAREAMEQHHPEAVVALLRPALQRQPDSDPRTYLLLAQALWETGDADAARQTCDQGLQQAPGSLELERLWVAVVLHSEGGDTALSELRQRLQAEPDSSVYRKALAQALMARGVVSRDLLQMLAGLTQQAPKDAEAHFLYGKAAFLLQQDQLAIDELTRAHALAGDNVAANIQIYTFEAIAHDHLGQSGAAEADFREALAANRRLPHPMADSANAYIDFLLTAGRRQEADALNDEILRWQPNYAPALFHHAQRLDREHQLPAAIAEAEKALDGAGLEPGQIIAVHAFLAKTCYAAGQVEQAEMHQKWIEAHQPTRTH